MSTYRHRAAQLTMTVFLLPLTGGCSQEAARARQHEPEILSVSVWKAKEMTFPRRLSLDATLAPSRRVLVGPPVPGVITEVTKEEGDPVRKGEVLVRVSPKEIYVQTIPLRSQLEGAKAQAEAAQKVLAKLQAPYERAKKLYEAGVISRMKFDEVQVKYSTAKAQKEAAEYTVRKLKRELRRAYSKLSDTVLRAPFDGHVIRRLVDEGDMARAFPPTIVLVLAKTDPLYVSAEVPEDTLGALRVGQEVTVTVDALPSEEFKAKLVAIRPDVDPITRTAKVRGVLANPSGRLLPGMSATIHFEFPPIRALAVKRSFLASKPSGRSATIFLLQDGRVALRRITLGRILDPDWQEVVAGLKPGELVVTSHLDELKPGRRVTVEDHVDLESPRSARPRARTRSVAAPTNPRTHSRKTSEK